MSNTRQHGTLEVSLGTKLLLLAAIFFTMLIAASLVVQLVSKISLEQRTSMLLMSALQGILIFIVPALVFARTFSKNPIKYLSLDKAPTWRNVAGIFIIYLIGMPFLNQIIFWNENITFPESLHGLEQMFRQMENQAMDTTHILLDTTSFLGMICGVLIIGVLTGFAEESFFRGTFQQSLTKGGVRSGVAILIVAVVFSAMHFQFFGFIPRILLGAFFGYLLCRTGSLWNSVIAHILNNSIVVVSSWMIFRNYISEDIDKIGVAESGFPWIALISLTALILFFKYLDPMFFPKNLKRK